MVAGDGIRAGTTCARSAAIFLARSITAGNWSVMAQCPAVPLGSTAGERKVAALCQG
jgi:hypothetical protein